jgi:uncharacterized Zn-binding protein involved in type VI secretion
MSVLADKSKVWVQKEGGPPPPPSAVPFDFQGPLEGGLSQDVLIMGLPAATVGSTAINAEPPSNQEAVKSAGKLLTKTDDTGTVIKGSSAVLINSRSAARNGDLANTWDYSVGPSPGKPEEKTNATLQAAGSVLIGD